MTKVMTKERLAAFSDAIIAIIMTILVLELEKPDELSWMAIWELRMSFLAFAVSFFGLAVMWADWHREWHKVNAISDTTVWSMIFVMFFMAFVPYITGLLARDFTNPVALILYGAIAVLFTFCNSLSYRSLAVIEENKEYKDSLSGRSKLLLINTAIMLVCVILSITVFPYFSVIGIVIISVIFVIPKFKK